VDVRFAIGLLSIVVMHKIKPEIILNIERMTAAFLEADKKSHGFISDALKISITLKTSHKNAVSCVLKNSAKIESNWLE